MVNVIVLKPFYDLHIHEDRVPGDEFEISEERFANLQQMLPGYLKAVEDYDKMTLQELMALAKERGVMPKGRASKAQLIEILSKE